MNKCALLKYRGHQGPGSAVELYHRGEYGNK